MAQNPSAGHVVADQEMFRETCRFGKEHGMDVKTYIVCDMSNAGANMITTAAAAPLSGAGGGDPPQSTIGASLIMSLLMDTTDDFAFRWEVPNECDLTKDIDFRVSWSDDAAYAAGETAIFAFLYTVMLSGATAEVVGVVPMDTDAAAQTAPVTAANVTQWTAWNTIDANTLVAAGVTPGDDHLNMWVTCTLVTMGDASVHKVQCRIRRRYF